MTTIHAVSEAIPDLKPGDRVHFEPNPAERRYDAPVTGTLREVIKNQNDEPGYHIIDDTPEMFVWRVWLHNGTITKIQT